MNLDDMSSDEDEGGDAPAPAQQPQREAEKAVAEQREAEPPTLFS